MRVHEIVQNEGGQWTCTVCGWTWTAPPYSECPGVTRYVWGGWPEHLKTKKSLDEAGYSTGKTKLPPPAGVVARRKSPGGWMWLYDVTQAVPKKTLSEAQRAHLDRARELAQKAQSCPRCGVWSRYGKPCPCCREEMRIENDQFEAATAAREWLEGPFVILDVETTGLDGEAEIVQIGIIDESGAVLMDQLVKPEQPIPPDSTAIHGITDERVRGAPSWPAVYDRVRDLLQGRSVMAYNMDFDWGKLDQVNRRHGLPDFETGDRCCAMELFAQFYGEWSQYHGNYRYQRLEHAATCCGVGFWREWRAQRRRGLPGDAGRDPVDGRERGKLTWLFS